MLEFPGQLNGKAASLRLLVRDGGEPALRKDSFIAAISSKDGASLYGSGTIPVTAGDLQVHP